MVSSGRRFAISEGEAPSEMGWSEDRRTMNEDEWNQLLDAAPDDLELRAAFRSGCRTTRTTL